MEPLFGGVIGILIALVLIFVFVLAFRWLWNTTMPQVFNLKEITLGQALRLLLLASLLFGGHRVVEIADPETSAPSPMASASQS